MGNYLNLMKRQQVISLLELGWTYRRIEAETGVRRETVSRYDQERQQEQQANAAKVFPGSDGDTEASQGEATSKAAKVFAGSAPKAAKVFAGSRHPRHPARATAAAYKGAIEEKLDQGLTAQRIWQDLVEEYGYGASYESVKRFIRGMERPQKAVGVYHSEPGEVGQIDFFRGAPTFNELTGEFARPWVFRITLYHSRHGYEEAIWDQKMQGFLALHENAFHDFGGVPRVLRHDNTKTAVSRACFEDPDSNDIYLAFGRHWGFTPLPQDPGTQRRMVRRSGAAAM
jgi:transposase